MRPEEKVLKLPDNVGVGEVGVRLPDLQTAALQPLQGEVAHTMIYGGDYGGQA